MILLIKTKKYLKNIQMFGMESKTKSKPQMTIKKMLMEKIT